MEARENPSPFNEFNLGSEYLAARRRREGPRALRPGVGVAAPEPGLMSSAGYAPLLVARAASARRGAGDLAAAARPSPKGSTRIPDHTDLVFEAALCGTRAGRPGRGPRELAERCLEMGDAPARTPPRSAPARTSRCRAGRDRRSAQGDPPAPRSSTAARCASIPSTPRPVLPLAGDARPRRRAGAEVAAGRPRPAQRPGSWPRPRSTRPAAPRPPSRGSAHVLERAARERAPRGSASPRRCSRSGATPRPPPRPRPSRADSPLAGAAVEVQALRRRGRRRQRRARAAIVLGRRGRRSPAHELELYRRLGRPRSDGDAPPDDRCPPPPAAVARDVLEALLRVEEVDAFAVLLGVCGTIAADPRERHEHAGRHVLPPRLPRVGRRRVDRVVQTAPDARALLGLAQVAVAQGPPRRRSRVRRRGRSRSSPGTPTAAALTSRIKQRFPQAA